MNVLRICCVFVNLYIRRGSEFENKTCRFESTEAVETGPADPAEHAEDLLPGAVLPLGVHAEDDERPGEQHRRGLHPGEVEELALLDHVLGAHPQAACPAVHVGLQQQAEQVVAAGLALLDGALPLLDHAPQDPFDLPVDLLHPPVVLCRQEPACSAEGMYM